MAEGDALAIFEAMYGIYFGRRNGEKISIILNQVEVVGVHCALPSEGQWISLALSKALYENYQNYIFWEFFLKSKIKGSFGIHL